MEWWVIFLILLSAVMMIASTAIGIQCINDPKTKREQYLIVTLILSILIVLIMGYVIFQGATPSNTI
jgi:hypothetical protein